MPMRTLPAMISLMFRHASPPQDLSGLHGSILMTLILPLGSKVMSLTLSARASPSIPFWRKASRISATEILFRLRAV